MEQVWMFLQILGMVSLSQGQEADFLWEPE